MIADPPTAEELERLRAPVDDQLDLEADPYRHLIDLDAREDTKQQ